MARQLGDHVIDRREADQAHDVAGPGHPAVLEAAGQALDSRPQRAIADRLERGEEPGRAPAGGAVHRDLVTSITNRRPISIRLHETLNDLDAGPTIDLVAERLQ
jgi:hypothetical protein